MEENWSNEELAASVQGYLLMLKCQDEGDEYSKSDVIRGLQSGMLGARSRSAIEYRMRNITFVMEALDRTWVRGYKPARNVGQGVMERIHSMIEADERARESSFDEADGVSAGVPRLPTTTPAISRRMSAVRQKDTGPELEVRRAIHALGYRFRTHAKDLPGRPDIVFRGRKKVIFVHGCYWHRHEGCRHATTPKTNTEFWQRKFEENVRRDEAAIEELKRLGWSVLLVWSCELEYKSVLLPRLKSFLGYPRLSNDTERREPRMGEPVLNHDLLRRVAELELSARSHNCLRNYNIVYVGDLAQMSEPEMLSMRNFGRKSLNEIKEVLAGMGFQLGMVIPDWPPENIGELVEKLKDQGLLEEPLTGAPHSTIDEEFVAAVETAVPERMRCTIYARSGWRGEEIATLEQLGDDPNLSGLDRTVTRERIRQIERKAFECLRRRAFGTPVLDRALNTVREATPLAVGEVPTVLKNAGLSKLSLGFHALRFAAEAFGREWNVELTYIRGISYIERAESNYDFNELWSFILDRSARTDYLSVEEFEDGSWSELNVRRAVEIDPRLEWLDEENGIFWKRSWEGQGWNKPLYVCRKIFSFANEVSLGSLHSALGRARTVDRVPPVEVLKSMLIRSGEFTIFGDAVRATQGTKFNNLNRMDRIMLSACLELGRTVKFTALKNFLVKTGMSSNYAGVQIIKSPLLEHVSRGYYSFIAEPSRIDTVQDDPVDDVDPVTVDQSDGVVVDFKVTSRHLVIGTHRLGDVRLEPGSWPVKDLDGADLGVVTLNGRRLSGLADVFRAASIGSDANVGLRFLSDADTVILRVYQ